ncbi:hypothetical protein BDV24DRAFT_138068 [Aspergillus arachidicola]|uniref:Secreted protein n=1 Tax=Aspergillus arachidicola TaxID=656916 RepID=A0A5N6XZ14_9EURO|nr:hypothetical protein BDV24DRAFT_138068 [Aspergillus arachidicola]
MTIKIIKIFLFCVFSVQVSPVSVFHQVRIHPLDDGRCRDHLEAKICITYVLFSGSSNSELCLDDTQESNRRQRRSEPYPAKAVSRPTTRKEAPKW